MAQDKVEDKREQVEGVAARHPLRTLGAAFVAGTVVGVGMAKAQHEQSKPGWQKMLDKLDL